MYVIDVWYYIAILITDQELLQFQAFIWEGQWWPSG